MIVLTYKCMFVYNPSFCIFRKILGCANLYRILYTALGEHTHTEIPKHVNNRVVDMYHGECLTSDQERVVDNFANDDSSLRCVIATSAFGLGVQISDVRHIVHWGPPCDLLDYWQQVGRGGRDGEPSTATMYLFPGCHPKNEVKEDMLTVCGSTSCVRQQILQYLYVKGMDTWEAQPRNLTCCFRCEIA